MSVVKHPVSGFSGINSNDLVAQHNLVRLSDADRVHDDPEVVAFRPGPRDTSSTFVFETNLRGALGNVRSPEDAIEHAPVGEDAWTGLEANQTLGQLISQTRKHRGLSREQVAAQTHIPAYYVRMIESDSYDAIPDQLYLLPFFRRYADFLGLDAKKVVTRFICDFEKAENEIHETPGPSAYAKALARWREIAAATVLGAILLPCIAWGIGSMRRAYRHAAEGYTDASSSPDRRSPGADAYADLQPLAAAAPVRVPDAITPSAATLSTANVESNSGSQVAPPRAQARRSVHSHRLTRHSRRSRQKPRRLT
jgi:transcriptional regulator with XRE-family HTH domain